VQTRLPRMAALAIVVAGLAVAAVAGTALAAGPAQTRTSVAHLEDRPDSGVKGTWATDDFRRTVVIVQWAPGKYHATVKDDGRFQAIPGAPSPQNGTPIEGRVTGSIHGSYTEDFTAAPDFATYRNFARGRTFRGDAGTGNPTTGAWVGSYFSDGGSAQMNNDWSWTYSAGHERWVDAAYGTYGDITGRSEEEPAHW
jgi:hypothetical protein